MQHLVIGAGRVGLSMANYAAHLGCKVQIVGRRDLEERLEFVRRTAAAADVVAVAAPDDAIANVLTMLQPLPETKTVIHFAGARIVEGATSTHPLYSFPKGGATAEAVARAPFALEGAGVRFDEIYPGATNPTFVVGPEDRALYHALAVLSANFAAHIWNACAGAFADRFPDAPPDALAELLQSCVDRFREAPLDSMTGPVARRDAETIGANRAALAETPQLAGLYDAFLVSAWPEAERLISDGPSRRSE